MSGVLNGVLICFLLHSVQCDEFSFSLPKQIEVLSGSCVTIPCTFQIQNKHKDDLHRGCKAIWKDAYKGPTVEFIRQTTGDLTQNNCTTTLYGITSQHNRDFVFRLDCNNALKYTFDNRKINIIVKDSPPTPTLTPPTLTIREGQPVSVQCSAPVPCRSAPPLLTWTPDLGDIQETLQEQQDKTYVKVSTLNFTASYIHHERTITCTAAYSREDGTTVSAQQTAQVPYGPRNTRVTVSPPGPVTEHSDVTLTCSSDANPAVKHYLWYKADGGNDTLMGNTSVLNINASKDTTLIFCEAQNDLGTDRSSVTQLDVLFSPQILNSSNCTGNSAQISCLCQTEGNPFPMIHWDLHGISANVSIISETLSNKALRSIIRGNKIQWSQAFTLVCHSSNSLGSDRQRFYIQTFEKEISAQSNTVGVTTPVLMATVVNLLVLVCILLFVIRNQNIRLNKCQSSAVTMEQLPESTEPLDETQMNIYANSSEVRPEEQPNSSNPTNTDGEGKASDSGQDSVVYSTVNWKPKSKKVQDTGDAKPSCSSYLEEQRSIVGDGSRHVVSDKLMDCEYAQVKFKPKKAKQ